MSSWFFSEISFFPISNPGNSATIFTVSQADAVDFGEGAEDVLRVVEAVGVVADAAALSIGRVFGFTSIRDRINWFLSFC